MCNATSKKCEQVPSCTRANTGGGIYLRSTDDCGATWTAGIIDFGDNVTNPATGKPAYQFQTDWDRDGIEDWRAAQDSSCGTKVVFAGGQKYELPKSCKSGDIWAGGDRFEMEADAFKRDVLYVSGNVLGPPQTKAELVAAAPPCNLAAYMSDTTDTVAPNYNCPSPSDPTCAHCKFPSSVVCGDGVCDPGTVGLGKFGTGVKIEYETSANCPTDCGMPPATNYQAIVASPDGGATWKLIATKLNALLPIAMTTTANGRLFAFRCLGGGPPYLSWLDQGADTPIPLEDFGAGSLPGVDLSSLGANAAPPCTTLAGTAQGLPVAGHLHNGALAWSITRKGADDPGAVYDTVRVVYPGTEFATPPVQGQPLPPVVQIAQVVEVTVQKSPLCSKNGGAPPPGCVVLGPVRTIRGSQTGWSVLVPHFIQTNRVHYPGDDPRANAAMLQFLEAGPFVQNPDGTLGQYASRFQLVVGDAWTPTQSFPRKLAGDDGTFGAYPNWTADDGVTPQVTFGEYWYGDFYAQPSAANDGTSELLFSGLWSQTDPFLTGGGGSGGGGAGGAGGMTPVSTDAHTNTVRVLP